MPAVSRIIFDLNPRPLDGGQVAIVADLYREDTYEVSATLTECAPGDVPEALTRCRSHLLSLGMSEREPRPSCAAPDATVAPDRA